MAFYLFFYRLFLLLYKTGVWVAALQNKKAKLWLQGRENWHQKLQKNVQERFTEGQQTIWMHCASLGEFEQGRPIFEDLKKRHPQANFIITFFSPSGYEVRKNYAAAQVVCYLPIDSPNNAKAFLTIVKPSLVLWIKYEYWYFYLTEIKNQNIPLLLVSGIFREGQPFFKWYGGLHRKMLQSFTALFVQNKESAQLAASVAGGEKVQVTGDTRFDRVVDIAENFQTIPAIQNWIGTSQKIMVCGSTWDEDEKELSHYVKLHPEIKFIIAPHNVNDEEIREIQTLLPDHVLYSQLLDSPTTDAKNHVLIIDTIGILSSLYRYATITYVGGGFGGGIHNVLEAAVYGKPVVHGPEYSKFAEAKDLVALGGSFETEDALHLEKLLDKLFTDTDFYKKAASVSKDYVYAHRGATAAIAQFIQEKRLLTNP